MRIIAGIVITLWVIAISNMSTASAAGKCTGLRARCAVEIGGTCDPNTGRWRYGRWEGRDYGGSNHGGAFDACISRGRAGEKRRHNSALFVVS